MGGWTPGQTTGHLKPPEVQNNVKFKMPKYFYIILHIRGTRSLSKVLCINRVAWTKEAENTNQVIAEYSIYSGSGKY